MQQSASVLLNRLLARARFRHMQVLVQLAELGSVRRTAEKIGMTQPGVTQLLRDLETMLDTPLFQRHARGVRPTPACLDLLPLAQQLLGGMATAAEAVAHRHGAGQGIVRVAGTTAAINGLLVRAIPEFNDQESAVQVHVRESQPDALLEVARGDTDMVCLRRVPVVPEGWQFHELLPDRFAVVCAPDHPLARKRQVAWADLATEPWLPAPAGSIARARFDVHVAQFAQAAEVCNVITRVPSLTRALLRHRHLLTLVPFGVMRHMIESGELAELKLKEPMPLAPLGMLLPAEGSGAATLRLADFLRQFCSGKKPHARR